MIVALHVCVKLQSREIFWQVSHRLEQLEDTSRSTVHQVKQADVRLQASPWILVTLACRLVWLLCISALAAAAGCCFAGFLL